MQGLINHAILCVLILLLSGNLIAQSVSGTLSLLKNQPIRLEGFSGLKTYLIASDSTDQEGHFRLGYSSSDVGVGFLKSADDKPMIVILSGEDVEIKGEALINMESMRISKGRENLWFERYAREHPRREQALSAWAYLEKMYRADTLFSKQVAPAKAILKEKQRIGEEDSLFLSRLPKDSYVRWFLPMRKMISSVSTIAQYRTEEIPATLAAFRSLDYADVRLYKSGLFKDAIESHFWLLENCGKPLDSVFQEMKNSIDALLPALQKDEKKFNEVTDFLFDLLERHSLFQASEYLALKVLNEVSCTLNSDLARQLETYRAMKKGNTAPDFDFSGKVLYPAGIQSAAPSRLSDLRAPYTLLVFGSSACPKCKEEVPQIATYYQQWRAQGLEVVFVSLDESEKEFREFSGGFPFISMCDFKKWKSPVVESYYVFGTPSMFLLDAERKILLRPNSVNQMNAWFDWYLVKGNPQR